MALKFCGGFPQVTGAIDGTHIPVVCPKDSPSDYYNRKGMQALVDFQGLFHGYLHWVARESTQCQGILKFIHMS